MSNTTNFTSPPKPKHGFPDTVRLQIRARDNQIILVRLTRDGAKHYIDPVTQEYSLIGSYAEVERTSLWGKSIRVGLIKDVASLLGCAVEEVKFTPNEYTATLDVIVNKADWETPREKYLDTLREIEIARAEANVIHAAKELSEAHERLRKARGR